MNKIEIIPVTGLPIVKKGDPLSKLLCETAEKQGTPIENNDIIIITHVIVSRSEGNVVDLSKVKPSDFAKNIGRKSGKDPALVEVVLKEASGIARMNETTLITITKHGFICANSGVDKSNVPGKNIVALLPKNPDKSARKIRKEIEECTGKKVAIIISDTHGRPLRDGEINIAIGVSGIQPIYDRRGMKDLFGYILEVKRTAVADELASAAELVMGQSDEGIPAVIIRGFPCHSSEKASSKDLLRPFEKELFL